MPSVRPQVVQRFSHLQRAQGLQTAPFTYDLPQNRIASRPLPNRDDAKLLVVPRDRSPPRHHTFANLPALLPSNTLIVRNATRVIPARIPVQKRSGGRAEILLLHPQDAVEPQLALSTPTTKQCWNVLLGGRNLSIGDVLTATNHNSTATDDDTQIRLEATIKEKDPMASSVSLTSDPVLPLRSVLSQLGLPPLPPYIRRDADINDWKSFQTVYAAEEGSVAAPTAGLHVTPRVLSELNARHIQIADVVLHIGTATFRQIKADVAGRHDMHHESISVSGHTVQQLASHVRTQSPIVALGTTSVRTIESLYWFGARLLNERLDAAEDFISVGQWEPYFQMDHLEQLPTPYDALATVLDWCGGPDGHVHGGTNLIIVPGYRFMITNALITNFHQPKSTLLMLVSAFYGGQPDNLAAVYQEALDNNYRFLSYGDSSIYADANFFQK